MKKNIYFFIISVLLFTSCLKDTALTDYINIKPVILIPNSNWPSTNYPQKYIYNSVDGPQQIKLFARVSWGNTFNYNIKVSFKKNQAVVTDFNNQWGTAYENMPENGYTISDLQLTIPAGTRESYIPITINAGSLLAPGNYILAFTIADSQGQVIARNFNTVLFPIEIQ